jgi:hypothetical protein
MPVSNLLKGLIIIKTSYLWNFVKYLIHLIKENLTI